MNRPRLGEKQAGAGHPTAETSYRMCLEVLRDNAPAIAFYERCGGSATRDFWERVPGGTELPVIEYAWTPEGVKTLANG
ncbi:hypothetical protein [Nonomuraea jabiensis]|uniref:hypothetical protein n=1 Tax=Nonomuraea jabiensis TaxID=882448 RepID=UPI00369D4E4F